MGWCTCVSLGHDAGKVVSMIKSCCKVRMDSYGWAGRTRTGTECGGMGWDGEQ
jgi:hypothetical protein